MDNSCGNIYQIIDPFLLDFAKIHIKPCYKKIAYMVDFKNKIIQPWGIYTSGRPFHPEKILLNTQGFV